MKLMNKRTGKIVEWFNNTDGMFPNSLAELNAEWEDYEEPKEYWCITGRGNLHYLQDMTDENNKDHREIGNYFDTKEEAEKVVEKLKAWKRLKDKGFRFTGWMIPEEPKTPHNKLVIEAEMGVSDSPYDLDICFGDEE